MTVETSYDSGHLQIALTGELDHHTAKSVMDAIAAAIDLRLPHSCAISFGGVSFMDSSGIAVIIRAKRRMDELGGEFSVSGLRPQPLKVVNAAGLGKTVNIAVEA